MAFDLLDTIPLTMTKRGSMTAGVPAQARLAAEALPVLQDLQRAIAEVIAAVPHPVRRAADLCKALDLDYALGWKLHRVATSTDAMQAGPYVPSTATMRRFLQSALEKGVAETTINAAARAFTVFETLVKTHSADRSAFNSMIRDVRGAEAGKDDLKNKRAAYRANRHIHGVHADLSCKVLIINTARDGKGYDTVGINGYVQIQQVRGDTTLLSESGVRMCKDDYQPSFELLDEREWDGPTEISLLQDFCSRPLPIFKTSIEDESTILMESHSRGLGNSAALTYFYGGISRGMWHETIARDHELPMLWQTNVPSEASLYDVWLHESVWPGTEPTVSVHWPRGGFNFNKPLRESTLMPMKETMLQLGMGGEGAFVPEFPRYTEMIRYSMDRVKWSLSEFRLFRCRAEYPVQGSVLRLTFPVTVPQS